jgi:hypothetical protein
MKGSQEPRIKIEPKRADSDGELAATLMQEYGSGLDEWQRLILDCWLGKDKEDKYNVTSAGLSVPRQNGKNVCLEAREFFGLVINGEKILHTAHQVKTSKKSFRRLAAMFTDKRHPEITDIVKQIRYTNGEESIELDNGGSIQFSSRSRQAARGFDGISLVIYDEAQELTDDQVEATMATLAASSTGTRQIIYTGTPPYPGCPGVVFRRRRTACTSDPGKHDSWHEWSVAAESLEEIQLDDTTIWYNTNPALGIWLSEEFTAEEYRTMTADGFARERLGWWSPVLTKTTEYVIDEDLWDACASDEEKPEGKKAYGVKFSLDGSEVCLCGAVISDSKKSRISVIERKSTSHGTRWLAEWLNERYKEAACVVIDGRNGVDVLIDRISDVWKAKGSVVRPSTKDVIASAGMLIDGLAEQSLTWYRKQDVLRDSALSATKRKIGSSGGWGFGGEDSILIEACALALWGVKTSKRNPAKKMLIG